MTREPWHIVIDGHPPRTKKTSNVLARAGRRHVVLPSAAWRRWVKLARIQVCDQPPTVGGTWFLTGWRRERVACRALFYRDADRGDLIGYMQGLADLLENCGILANDRQIISWDGSRLLKDAAHPRVEVTLEEMT